MRVCFITEGCYPYIVGGVSGWVHSMIRAFSNLEYSVLAVITDREMSGKFVYDLPENVCEVHEVYLDDKDWGKRTKQFRFPKNTYKAIRSLVLGRDVEWDVVFDYFQEVHPSLNDLLMGTDFYRIVKELYDREYPEITFTDFLWTMRSVYLPLFQVLNSEVPRADIYHCVATGYAGILGCMAQHRHGGRIILSEHGIYTRERVEELIKANWVKGFYKNIWIDQFKKLSQAVYDRAAIVTSLFESARELQQELGCSGEKQRVIPNGIDVSRFQNIPQKDKDDPYVEIGAIVRVTPIKDIKTLIQGFHIAKQSMKILRLWIMGPDNEDEEYAEECRQYVEYLGVKDVIFTGRINTLEYIGKMDFTILTSISEGQPLTILEGYAAHKPAIATDVGNCRGLLYGEGSDTLGNAGILTHVMSVEEIAAAMMDMALHRHRTQEMGEIGYQRLLTKYTLLQMWEAYRDVYRTVGEELELPWQESESS